MLCRMSLWWRRWNVFPVWLRPEAALSSRSNANLGQPDLYFSTFFTGAMGKISLKVQVFKKYDSGTSASIWRTNAATFTAFCSNSPSGRVLLGREHEPGRWDFLHAHNLHSDFQSARPNSSGTCKSPDPYGKPVEKPRPGNPENQGFRGTAKTIRQTLVYRML
jgi:hypothetical protein